jgi:hypothetical protein
MDIKSIGVAVGEMGIDNVVEMELLDSTLAAGSRQKAREIY